VGRRKTALLLLALFILLPAYGAPIGLFLVLALLVAALPRANSRKKTAARACLILLPGALLTISLLNPPELINLDYWLSFLEGTMKAFWTYPALLVPLIVLAVVGWKKTALRLLIPCLLLLLYLNWPPDDMWRIRPGTPYSGYSLYPYGYLLDFSPPQPPRASGPGVDNRLYAHESWDWSGWYWLWPNQLASWALLKWALALVGGAEFVRWFIRKAKEGVP
jgi:hypothetical protein